MDPTVGEVYRMKRKHPCGAFEFRVFLVGPEIGLECTGCGRQVLLPRERFDSRARARSAPRA
jgi:hypothetical protein